MQDHSHRFLFLAATGVMCAISVYASQAGPTLLLPDRFGASTAPVSEETDSASLRQPIRFQKLESESQTADVAPANQTESSASVVPNDASCPAANAAALVSPPTVNTVIGSPTPIERTALPRQGLAGPALGTGSSCPPRRDIETPRALSATDGTSLNPKDRSALSGGIAGP